MPSVFLLSNVVPNVYVNVPGGCFLIALSIYILATHARDFHLRDGETTRPTVLISTPIVRTNNAHNNLPTHRIRHPFRSALHPSRLRQGSLQQLGLHPVNIFSPTKLNQPESKMPLGNIPRTLPHRQRPILFLP